MSDEEMSIDDYTGDTDMKTIDVLDCEIAGEDFFARFVAKRRPVVFTSMTSEFKGLKKWTNSYLHKSAGTERIRCEYRTSCKEKYGQGREKSMTFSTFLDSLEKGDEHLYMTTQELEYDDDGRPGIMSSPVTGLTGDFPIRPKLLGHLVPQNLNIWMGVSSSEKSSSGLHHDFHDNLYILLRGTKTFTLFPPTEVSNLYPVGKLSRLHPNGRINYEGQPTRADGAHVQADAAAAASRALEDAMRAGCEDDIDAALEAVLDAETFGDDGDDDDDEEEEEEEEEEDGTGLLGALGHALKRRRTATNEDESWSEDTSQASGSTRNSGKQTPSNFSRVDTMGMSEEFIAQTFPLFTKAQKRKHTVTLKAGQMLYLPAGWFHEVHSSGCHMAFNYWMHPPDNPSCFDAPYQSDFWESDFKAISPNLR